MADDNPCPHCAEPLPHPTPCAAQLGTQLAEANTDNRARDKQVDALRVQVAKLAERVAEIERHVEL